MIFSKKFPKMLSSSYLRNVENSNSMMIIFYILFYMCYNLVMLLFFVVIILLNYQELRKKIDLTTTAIANISTAESKALTNKWMNLLFMKPPIDEDYSNKNEQIEKPSHSDKCKFTKIK